MKKVILTEKQIDDIVNDVIIESEINKDAINMITQNINRKFEKFKSQYTEQINNTNKLIDMSQLIEEMKNYLIENVPNIIQNNIDHQTFLKKYYSFLYDKFNESVNNLGWGKKKLVKTVLGKKENATATIDTWKFKDIIWILLHLGNLGGDVDQEWGQNYKKLVSNNKQNLYEKVRDLLLNKIYS